MNTIATIAIGYLAYFFIVGTAYVIYMVSWFRKEKKGRQ
jgi:hypothetical protein